MNVSNNMNIDIKSIIATIIMVGALITGVITLDSRYATSEDLKKTEIQLVQTLEKFQKDMINDRLEQRYINLTDQVYQYKALIKKNPKDTELKEDYIKLEQERQDVKKKMEKR